MASTCPSAHPEQDKMERTVQCCGGSVRQDTDDGEKKRSSLDSSRSSMDECVICRDAMRKSALSLACGHIFCALCVVKLVGKGLRTCPVCRACIDLYHIQYAADKRSGARRHSSATSHSSASSEASEVTNVAPWEAHNLSSWHAPVVERQSATSTSSPVVYTPQLPVRRAVAPNAFNRSVSVFNKPSLSSGSFLSASTSRLRCSHDIARPIRCFSEFLVPPKVGDGDLCLAPNPGTPRGRNSPSSLPMLGGAQARRNSISSPSLSHMPRHVTVELFAEHAAGSSSLASQDTSDDAHSEASSSSPRVPHLAASVSTSYSAAAEEGQTSGGSVLNATQRSKKSPRSSIEASSPRVSTKSPRSSGEFHQEAEEHAVVEEAHKLGQVSPPRGSAHLLQHVRASFDLGSRFVGASSKLSSFSKRRDEK